MSSRKRPYSNPFVDRAIPQSGKKLVLHLPPEFVEKERKFDVRQIEREEKEMIEDDKEIVYDNKENVPLKHVSEDADHTVSVEEDPDAYDENEIIEMMSEDDVEEEEEEEEEEVTNGGPTLEFTDMVAVPSSEIPSSDDIGDVPAGVKDEISKLLSSFPSLSVKYRLVDKIGEGTFSSVYKAIDLQGILPQGRGSPVWRSPPPKRQIAHKSKTQHAVVALKRIYVTSSPQRIYNELHLLHSLVGCPNVAPLLDAIRFEDQVIAVLPYYKHEDFRDFYRDLPLAGIRTYMHELLEALSFVHEKKIIHRDIKPTNFLYNPFTRRGVLVDFGLAEKEGALDSSLCPCVKGGYTPEEAPPANSFPVNGYLKEDPRPGRRANRAGTRGFRAPEVLFKCPNQTRKLDVWSAGVMLLTLLARRFPFFNSSDDIDALAELTTVFGSAKMKQCARLHGLGFECNLPRADTPHRIGRIVYAAVLLDAKEGDTFADDSPAWEVLTALDNEGSPAKTELGQEYGEAMELLDACLSLDSRERATAEEALQMDFFKKHEKSDSEEVMLD